MWRPSRRLRECHIGQPPVLLCEDHPSIKTPHLIDPLHHIVILECHNVLGFNSRLEFFLSFGSPTGASMAGQKKYAEAEPLLTAGYEGMLQQQPTIPAANRSNLIDAGQRVVQFYQDCAKPDEADQWKQRLRLLK
jgi:hypothetical protein